MNQQAPPSADDKASAGHSGSTHKPAVEMSSLSEELLNLQKLADGKGMKLGEILDHLKDRGHMMFIIVIMMLLRALKTAQKMSEGVGKIASGIIRSATGFVGGAAIATRRRD